MAKKPQSPAQPEFTGQNPMQGHTPTNDTFIDDLKNTPANNPFAEFENLPDGAIVKKTGAEFWNFEKDGELFVGKFMSAVVGVGDDNNGEVIGYNTIGPDGVDRICPSNYAIAEVVEEQKNDDGSQKWGFCLWIKFIGKVANKKGGTFSQFKIAVIPDFTVNNLKDL